MKTTSPPPRAARGLAALPAEVPRRWAWHYRALQQLRDRLQQSRDEELAEAATPLEAHSMDIADSASDEFDHDLALGLLSHEEDAMREIEAAMHRIREDAYGICEETGTPIAAARLRAVPWTRWCAAVAERLEREGVTSPAHLAKAASLQGPGPGGIAQAEESEAGYLQAEEVARHKRAAAERAIIEGEEEEPAR